MTASAAPAPLAPQHVAPDVWPGTVAQAIAAGARAVSLHATADEVRLLLSHDGRERLLTCRVIDGAVPSLLAAASSLQWGEREAHDLHGVGFSGHEPLRPLVDHDPETARWTVPVTGRGTNQVAVGPIHAGVIESGHFRFHVVGERILHLDIRLFYKHRGLERAAEGATLPDGLAFVRRMCAACAVTNTVAYAQACEHAMGLWPEPELARARTVLLELERVYNHLSDIGQLCAGIGFAPGTMTFLGLKERAQRLNRRLTGHRFMFGAVAIAANPLRIDSAAAAESREELRSIGRAARAAWHEVLFNGSVQDRLDGVGVVTHDGARQLGAVGPAARASGIAHDVRTESPGLAYDDFSPAAPPRGAGGDVQARFDMRAAELWPALAILDDLLAQPVRDGVATPAGEGGPFGVSRVESPRGETAVVLEREGDRIARLHVRSGSNANWRVVAHAAGDNLLPDFPLVNKSFELCYACSDR